MLFHVVQITSGMASSRPDIWSLLRLSADQVLGASRSEPPSKRQTVRPAPWSLRRAIAFFKLGCHGHGALTRPCKDVKADPHSHGHVEAL